MTAMEIEDVLRTLGVPYYVAISRLPGMIAVARWKLRAAVESRSLLKFGDGTVSRADLANWLAHQPAIVSNLLEMVREPEVGSRSASLELTPAALKVSGTFTVRNMRDEIK